MINKIDCFEDLESVLDEIDALKPKLIINEEDLVSECVRQPVLHQDIGDLSCVVKDFVETLRADLNDYEKDLEKDIRLDPSKYFGTDVKVTEGAVKQAVQTDGRFRKLHRDLLDSESVERKVRVLLDRLQTRRSMIHDLVDMKVSSFYTSGDMTKPKRALLEVHKEEIGRKRLEKAREEQEHGQ